MLYGIVGALFAYCVSLVMASPLSAFAVVAGYQIVVFLVYLAAYLIILTYAKTSDAANLITIIRTCVLAASQTILDSQVNCLALDFTLAWLSPVPSVVSAT
jgi:hypothetical protein